MTNTEYICDDRPRTIDKKFLKMTEAELDDECKQRFGDLFSKIEEEKHKSE